MKFARCIYRIYNDPGREVVNTRGKRIIDWADKHEIHCNIGYNGNGNLMCEVAAEGYSSAFCRGMCAEIKEWLQREFSGKIVTMLDAH